MALEMATAVVRVTLNDTAMVAQAKAAKKKLQGIFGSMVVEVLVKPKISKSAMNSIRSQIAGLSSGSGAGSSGGGGSVPPPPAWFEAARSGRGGRGGGIGGTNMSRNASLMSGASRVATGRSLLSGKLGGFVKGSAQIATGILGAQAALSTIQTPVLAIQEYADFTSEMTRLRLVTQATAAEFKMLQTVVKETALGTKFTLVEAAEAAATLAQMGVSTSELEQMLPRTLEFATATRVSADEAARILLETMNQMDLTADESERAADVMSRFSVKTAADVRSLGSAMSYTGRIGKEVGLEIEELGGAIAFLAEAGLRGSRGGTALKNIFASLADKKTMEKARQILGEDFTLQIKNAKGEFIGFPELIAQFENSVKNTLDPMDSMNLLIEMFNRRGAPGFAAMLSKGSKGLKEFEDIAYDSSITTRRLAEEQMNNLTGAIQKLQTTISKAMVESVEPLADSLIGVVDALRMLTDQIPKLVDGVEDIATGFRKIGEQFDGSALKTGIDVVSKMVDLTAKASGIDFGKAIKTGFTTAFFGPGGENLRQQLDLVRQIGKEQRRIEDEQLAQGLEKDKKVDYSKSAVLGTPSRIGLMMKGNTNAVEKNTQEQKRNTRELRLSFNSIEGFSKQIQKEIYAKKTDEQIENNTKRTAEGIAKINRDGVKVDGTVGGVFQ